MRVGTDDDLDHIDSAYLGPKAFRLPWTWTYRRYIIALPIAGALALAVLLLGLPLNWWTFTAWVYGFVYASRAVDKALVRLPPMALAAALAQEAAAPRAEAPAPVTFTVAN